MYGAPNARRPILSDDEIVEMECGGMDTRYDDRIAR